MTTSIPARLSAEAVIPLGTLDPAAPPDDLGWLDEVVGDARVVAIGESAHYNAESYLLRHRLCRYLVERHGFGAYALEPGFTEGWAVDAWVRGGADADQPGRSMGDGMVSLMLMWTQVRAHLEWMRRHNATAARPVGYYGIDLGGANASPLTGLDAVTAYLARADPDFEVDPGLRETAASFAPPSPFSAPAAFAAYGGLPAGTRDAFTAGLAELAARMNGRRLTYRQRTGTDAHERALRSLHLLTALDTVVRAMARGDVPTAMFTRDAAMADTVEWILRREDRIVLAAHDAHVQRHPAALPGMPAFTPLGMHLADRLGEDYRVVGTTTGTGRTLNTGPDFYAGALFTELGAPEPDSLDGLLHASHDGPFATDLRRLPPADTGAVRAVTRQRLGASYSDVSPLDAYDALVHLPHVTAAEPDEDALARSPEEVREAFTRWRAR
ncbi:erythromycin esterase family protein [Saccharothrix xinjiangensis]|uniref:Erythromycin esterase family protein n=1 Tax=Saccharothrix xinjiangensis TaxID=204798 RepID=A0ABV9YAN9_9PSEU